MLQQSGFTLLFCRPGSSRPRSRPEGGGGGGGGGQLSHRATIMAGANPTTTAV